MNNYIKKLEELLTFYGGTKYKSTTVDNMKSHIQEELMSLNVLPDVNECRTACLSKIDKSKSTTSIVKILGDEYMNQIGLGED